MLTMVYHQLLLLYIPYIVFLPLAFCPTILSDIAADREALLRLSTSVQGRTIGWNTSSPTPCSWEGVTCDMTINRVTELRLPGDGLSRQIPLNSIGNLTALRTLSLRHNSLTGPLPGDIGSCTELRYLYLQDNKFSGELPPSFFQLSNLLRVNLARNNFSGELSPGFSNLTKLRTLYLENNQFNGSISELNSLRQLRELNVSFNTLTGSIPSNLVTFSSQSFLGNSLCDAPLQSCPDGGNKLSGGAIAGIVVGSVIGFLVFLLILFFLCVKYRSGKTNQKGEISPLPPSPMKPPEYDFRSSTPIIVREDYEFHNGSLSWEGAKKRSRRVVNNVTNDGLVFFYSTNDIFTMEVLLKASAEVLGKESIGTTYRAYLEGGHEVVVKRLKNVSVSERQFREKVEELGRLAHENLVPLKAYFYSRDEKLLVYESIPVASLDALLHGNRGAERAPLTWMIRSKIALGIASGIEYLHSLGPGVSHGNIKSSNILLTNYYDVRITEYSLMELVYSTSTPNLTSYHAPELVDSGKFSQKGDVYSFGVLVLELLTGKSPSLEGSDLPSWVRSVVKEREILEVFDPELLRHDNSEEQMVRLSHLALNCTSHDPGRRPSMKEVVRHIEEMSE